MQPRPINDAEAVIEAFWDTTLSDFDQCAVEPGEGTGARANQYWCWLEMTWDNARPGQRILTMSRQVDIKIEHYDALRIRCGIPSTARLTVNAVVDGRPHRIVDGLVGPDRKWEYTGPIEGGHLEQYEIVLDAVEGGGGSANLQWINLVNRQIETIRHSRSSPYSPQWPKFLEPQGRTIDPEPILGLLFDGAELAALRTKLSHPLYEPMMQALRARAREHLRAEPERFAMVPAATIDRHHRAHHQQLGAFDPANVVVVCGFVGLLDEDTRMLRMAARALMAMAHSPTWDESFIERFPGSAFDYRGFVAFDNLYASALGLDWVGSMLTDAGRALVCEAISKKGLTQINKDFLQYDYIYACNQAPGFSQGRIAALLAILPRWPHAAKWLDLAERDLRESLERVFNLTEDHGGLEGPGYTSATILRALCAYIMLARRRGQKLSDVVPPAMLASSEYFFMFLSTAGPAGMVIPYGDCGGAFALDFVSLMAIASGDVRWEQLRRAMLQAKAPADFHNSTIPFLYTLIFTDPPAEPGRVAVPTFRLLGSTGMVASCRPGPDGPVRLQLIGAAVGAGHVHQDKGSFVLEALGDGLAIDRGCLPYTHVQSERSSRAHLHNLLAPARIGDREPEQDMHVTVPILPTGSGDERSLDTSIDTTRIWAGQFERHQRRIYSPDPSLFFIDDDVAFDDAAPRGATFHLHSSFPIASVDGGYVVRGTHADLHVRPTWAVAAVSLGEDFLDYRLKPVNHLAITCEPGTRHRLITVLQVSKAGSAPRWSVTDDGAIVARGADAAYAYPVR